MEGMLEKRFHDVNNIIKNCLEGEDEELVSIALNVVKGTLKYSPKVELFVFILFRLSSRPTSLFFSGNLRVRHATA